MGLNLAFDLGAAIRLSGRSWWEARYRDGRVVSEWSTNGRLGDGFHLSGGDSSRWEEVSRKGLVGLRLLCPDGSVGELAAAQEHRLFQFKVGGIQVGIEGDQPWCSAHVIGGVLDSNGRCICRAWEASPGRLIDFEDNVFAMRYFAIGPLALDNLGLKV